jgi:spermidine/putrescine transport system ATP-binding protein
MTDWAVELEGVTKRFGGFAAVDRMTLQIARGEFFSLLGPSGCGKTTTLRLIAGFEQPSEGAIRLDGEDVASVPPYRRHVNTVFQSYALFEHLDVTENVAFGLRRRKVAKPEIAQRVAEALELVALDERATARPAELSGGQRQRVALARALVNRPSVLLLDEPLGALDLKLRKQMQVELKRIQREVGITFVYVTHDQEEALTMSDRIAVMNRGSFEQVDTPEEVYERPTTTFVAGFIGVSNLMPGEVVQADGATSRVRLDAGLEFETSTNGRIGSGERCHAVVRPEKLRLDPRESPSPNGWPSIEGIVESSVYLGTATQVVVRLPGDVPMTVLVPNADEDERSRLPGGGAPVRLSWAPEHIHVVKDSSAPVAAAQEGGPE